MKFCGCQRTRTEESGSIKERKSSWCVLTESSSCDPKKQKFIQVSPREMEFLIKRLYPSEFH